MTTAVDERPDTAVEDRRTFGSLLSASLRRGSALWLLAFIVILFSITAPSLFPTMLTLQIILSDHMTVGLVALATLIPLCAGQFDFSVGALLGLAMGMTAVLVTNGMDVIAASVIVLITTTALGVVNGFIVVKLHVNSFISALGISQIALAITYLVTQNQQVVPPLPEWFVTMTQGKFLGIENDVYYLFAVALILWYVLEHTPIGRSLFAVGGNPEAARLAGVGVSGLIWGSLVCSAFIAGLAGVLLVSKVGLYSQEYGPNYLFAAFAAVFFGATQLKSRPNVWGTLIALYVLATAVAGLQLTFFGNEYWITPLFNGVALLIAVALASRKHTARAYRRMRNRRSPDGRVDPDTPSDGPAIPAAVERGLE